MHPVLNPANALTASRFLTLYPFVGFVADGDYQWAAAMVLISGIIDKLDGKVAKLCNCSSGFGELFDAITDAVCYGFYLLTLSYYGWVPWWPIVAIIGMGVLNSLFRVVYVRRAGKATNFHSWAMVRMVGFIAYMTGLVISRYQGDYAAYWAVPLMAIILIYDGKRMLLDPVPE